MQIRFLFEVMTWVNILVLCLYHSDVSTTALDALLVTFAVLPWLEVVFSIWSNGFVEYVECRHEPSEYLSVRCTVLCLTVSLVGAILMLGAVPLPTARFFTSFSTMLVFTKSPRFNQILHTLISAIGNARFLVYALLVVSCIYALAAQDIFSNKVLNEVAAPFFSSYSRALSTTFRMFVDGSMVCACDVWVDMTA